MVKNIKIALWLTLLGVIGASLGVNAAEVTLAELQASGAQGAKLQILDRAGPQFLQLPASSLTWILRPAEPTAANARPNSRVIELYSGTPSAPTLLCRIFVRYYANRSGWLPYFQINEEPLLVRVNGRWQPIELIAGIPTLIAQTGNAVPNPEGFFPSLEFGLTVGTLPIVGWEVR